MEPRYRDDLPGRGLPAARAGGIGIGTVVVLALIGWALGIDPTTLIGGAEQMLPGGSQTQQQVPAGAPSDEMGHFVSAVLGSTEEVWTDVFARAGKTYTAPTLVMFSGATQSACGFAQAWLPRGRTASSRRIHGP